ncbi:MAG TPA: WD40 repeat domain-containing protein [Ktedonosporobacter sp.]|nr:WD40 repeat domain-containing protein [Ktedonosporobacter sp.]
MTSRKLTLLMILVGSSAILIGFCLPWFLPYYGSSITVQVSLPLPPGEPAASGLSLWLGSTFYQLYYAPHIAPEFFRLLWLLPLSALLTSGVALLQLRYPQWESRWIRLVSYVSLQIIIGIFIMGTFAGTSLFLTSLFPFIWFAMLMIIYLTVVPRLSQKLWRRRISAYVLGSFFILFLALLFFFFHNRGQYGLFLCLSGWLLMMIGVSEYEPMRTEQEVAGSRALTAGQRARRRVVRGLVALSGLASLSTGAFLWWRNMRVSATIFTSSFPPFISVSWSPDSRRVLTTSLLRSWDALTGHNVRFYQWTSASSAGWSPDGLHVAAVSHNDGRVVVFNAATGEQEAEMNTAQSQLQFFALSWSPDGQNLALGTQQLSDKRYLVKVWNPTSKTFGRTYGPPDSTIEGFICLAWSPDGRYLAASASVSELASSELGDMLYIWDTQKGDLVFQRPLSSSMWGHQRAFCWAPGSKQIALGARSVEIWDLTAQKQVLDYRGHGTPVLAVAWSPDGSLMASSGAEGIVHVWNAATGELRFAYEGHTEMVWDVAWSPDGLFIASGGFDGTTHIWQPDLSQ